jgi:hypothetical protein
MTEQQETIQVAVARMLKERLEQFEVPVAVRNELASGLLNLLGRPERDKTGATVMTAEASMEADRQRGNGPGGTSPASGKPRVL